jgi:hypothetical protein
MTIRFRTAAAFISTMLCAATVVLWNRSRTVFDSFEWSRSDVAGRRLKRYLLYFDEGTVDIAGIAATFDSASDFELFRRHWTPDGIHYQRGAVLLDRGPQSSLLVRIGFDFFPKRSLAYFGGGTDFTSWHYGVPLWILSICTMVLPLRSLLRVGRAMRERRTTKLGRCCACGYDLRATPERCPECGRVPAK